MRTTILLIFSLLGCTAGQSQHTILWRITKPGNPKPSWLLGTFHALGESYVDSLTIIGQKIDSAEMVITETHIDRAQLINFYNSRPGSDTLASMVSPEDLQTIKSISPGRIDIFKYTPGELFVKLSAGYIQNRCVPSKDTLEYDEYLQILATKKNKQNYYLEDAIMQTNLIDSMSRNITWKFFKANIPAVLAKYRDPKLLNNACALIRQYMSYDQDYGLDKKCGDTRLLQQRNDDWMTKLPALLQQHSCFIAVGFFHLCNRCGLIQQLRGLGYTVEPVSMNISK